MAAKVNIQYNPFLPDLMILIDGKQPAEYSRLTQFADEDIWKWHTKILDVLYDELRDDFFVTFIGTTLDTMIMKSECEQNSHCAGFLSEPPMFDIPLQKRLGKLNQFIKNNQEIIYQKSILQAYFVISPELQVYEENVRNLDISNLFCTTKIEILNNLDGGFVDEKNSFLFILAKNFSEGEQIIRKYNSQNPICLLYQGTEMRLKQVDSSYLAYEYDFSDIIPAIFSCFLGFPLMYAFRNCIKSISNGKINTNEIFKLTSITPVLEVKVEKNIEVGKSNIIQVIGGSSGSALPRVVFRILDETIATTDNLCVFGVKPGKTLLEAYYYGTRKPFQVCELNVIQRNRIKKIILDDDELVLGVGDHRRLHYDYSPVDADNINKIIWKSSDESIASVNSHGTLICRSSGTCKIWCIAENISAVCNCEVRPYLESLEVDLSDNSTDGQLYLEPMQEYKLKIDVSPENSIDKNYTIISSDYNIVNIVGNKVLAKNTGTATIEVENISGRKKTVFTVKVSKKKFWKKLFRK